MVSLTGYIRILALLVAVLGLASMLITDEGRTLTGVGTDFLGLCPSHRALQWNPNISNRATEDKSTDGTDKKAKADETDDDSDDDSDASNEGEPLGEHSSKPVEYGECLVKLLVLGLAIVGFISTFRCAWTYCLRLCGHTELSRELQEYSESRPSVSSTDEHPCLSSNSGV